MEINIIIFNIILFLISNNFKSRNIAFDPLLIFSFVHLQVIVSFVIGYNFYLEELNTNNWILFNDDNYIKILIYNSIFHATTIITYHLISKREIRLELNDIIVESNKIKSDHYIIHSKIWFFILCLLSIIDLVVFLLLQNINLEYYNYFSTYYSSVISISLNIFFSTLVLKLRSNYLKIMFVCIIPLIIFMINSFIFSENPVNRGGIITSIIFILSFISIYDYKFRFFLRDNILYGLMAVFILLALLNFIDGKNINILNFILSLVTSFEHRILENQTMIINSVDNNEIIMFKGSSYLNSINEFLYPFTGKTSLSEWFIVTFYPDLVSSESNSEKGYKIGFAFSFLAEGYLNFGIYGIFFASTLAAVFLIIIRGFGNTKSLTRSILYSSFAFVPYFIYRYHSLYFLKKLQITLISIFIIYLVYLLVIGFFITNKNLKHEKNEKIKSS